MAGFTDPFGGGTLKAAQVSYREFAMLANMATQWPAFADDTNVLAQTMRITSSTPGLSITLPPATQATPGEQVTFYNDSANPVAVLDNAGGAVATIAAGQRRLLELRNTANAAGAWLTTLLGVGTGTLDIAGAVGAGLRAVGTQLQVALQVEYVSANRALVEADRDKVVVWTGGSGTLTLPDAATVPDFNFEIRNQGSGTLTLAGTGGQQIDGSASIVFNSSESAAVRASSANAWHTIGRGRNAQFNFTLLQKTVDGGSDSLTLTEAANVIQIYSGTLLSNQEVVLPAIVQVYYVSNQTTGAFNLLFRNPGLGGGSVSIPQGQNAILISDGVNVINAATTVAGIGAITFAAGSAATPSVQIGAVNTGFFSPGSGQVAFSSGGTQVVTMSATGLSVAVAGNSSLAVASTTGTASLIVSRPAGQAGGVQVNSVNTPRVFFGANSDAEGGSNSGSNFVVTMYNDAGVLIADALKLSRAQGTQALATLTDTNVANGVNLRLLGDGAITPSKTFRVKAGALSIMNDAYSAALMTLTDAGNMSISNGLTVAASLSVSGGAAVTGNLGVTGSITASGNITAFSDERLKSEVRAVSEALARLRKTLPVTYIKDGAPGRGYLAQRMAPVYPELVERHGEFFSFNYMGMVAELHAAVLELDRRVNRPSLLRRAWRAALGLFDKKGA